MSDDRPRDSSPEYGSPQYGTPQPGGPQYGGPQYGTPQPGGPRYGGPQYGTPQYGSPQPGTPQYGAPPGPVPQAAGYPGGGVPGAPYGVDAFGRPYSDKSKIIAGLLQLLIGYVGAGRWYTGHYGIAVAQLLTCGGLGIWSLIDGVLLLVSDSATDAQGRLLRS